MFEHGNKPVIAFKNVLPFKHMKIQSANYS